MNHISNPVIIFDGICNLCNGAVQFVIRNDHKKTFRFTSLQGNKASQILQQYGMKEVAPDSFLLMYNDRIYDRSTAALLVMKMLGGRFTLLYGFIIVPRFIRDAMYNVVAKNRYKWFGKKESCMIPDKKLADLFLD